MKKAKSTSDELRAEYKRSDFNGLERGKYYERIKAGPEALTAREAARRVAALAGAETGLRTVPRRRPATR